MPPRGSKGEELEYPFFKGDGSSFDEWRDDGVAGDDYEGPLIVDDDQFEDELEMGDDAFVLIGKEPSLQLPNMPHDRMSPGKHEKLRRQVEELVSKGLPYHDDSSNDDLIRNSRTNFIYPWGNDKGPSIEERALLFLEAQDRVKKKA
nr:putative reverse transcriptase domain-containing protein [Tanacetum cinerariifolium]